MAASHGYSSSPADAAAVLPILHVHEKERLRKSVAPGPGANRVGVVGGVESSPEQKGPYEPCAAEQQEQQQTSPYTPQCGHAWGLPWLAVSSWEGAESRPCSPYRACGGCLRVLWLDAVPQRTSMARLGLSTRRWVQEGMQGRRRVEPEESLLRARATVPPVVALRSADSATRTWAVGKEGQPSPLRIPARREPPEYRRHVRERYHVPFRADHSVVRDATPLPSCLGRAAGQDRNVTLRNSTPGTWDPDNVVIPCPRTEGSPAHPECVLCSPQRLNTMDPGRDRDRW
ncbi:hypothetical protein VTK73DRAFT_2946 [Phialemonium thermophilum]|uniref:Uncharacterized protein n=1 Tax=Phialemonium thermophilum TaxID=223376 RepID=A0ABR3VMH9_9PEZI